MFQVIPPNDEQLVGILKTQVNYLEMTNRPKLAENLRMYINSRDIYISMKKGEYILIDELGIHKTDLKKPLHNGKTILLKVGDEFFN